MGILATMNPEVKAGWISDLRSGKFPQTMGFLKDTLGYCCLGILCNRHDPTLWNEDNESYSTYGKEETGEEEIIPPPSVIDWANLNVGLVDIRKINFDEFPSAKRVLEGWVDIDPLRNPIDILTILNDEGESFESIARFIEIYL